jgi:C-terminal processing protease CtpA/Prc
MVKMRLLTTLACLIALVAMAQPAGSRWFGLKLRVDADGIFNPKVRSITVETVSPASPAEKAGLVAGDLIIEVQGKTVAGAKASDLKAPLEGSVGDSLRLTVRHASAEPREVTLIAAPKP